MKKIISIILAILITVSFAACSNSSHEGEIKVWYFNDNETDGEELFSGVEDTIDPNSIFSSLQYEENMLYGVYAINDLENDLNDVSDELTFRDIEFDNGTFNTSSLPVAVYSGTDYLPDNQYLFRNVTDREVAVLQFIAEDQLGTVPCTYEINGNTIRYTVLTETGTSEEDFSYELDDVTFEYNFTLCGPYLTLTDGNDSLQLTAFSFTDNNKSDATSLYGYSIEQTPLIDELDYFSSQQDSVINYAVARDGSYYDNSAFKLTDDGKCTVYLAYTDESGNPQTIYKQYAYIVQCSGLAYLNSFCIMLLDGEKIYSYTDDVTDREARILNSEGIDTDSMDSEELEAIAQKKSDLYDDLYNEFKANGISVQINRATGEIAMDSTVLFGGDSAELTDEGKAFLDKFLNAYTTIIYNEKYDGFISKTMIEGHIAPVSGTTYEGGMPLSERRAENVRDYCLSGETGVDTSKLAPTLETVGYSQSRPVYDADGNVDIEASRRVSFRFIVNTD